MRRPIVKFTIDEAEYVGLLRIKSVVEAALRSRDHWISEVGYAKMFELIQKEVEAYYVANNQPIPQLFMVKVHPESRGGMVPFPIDEQEKTDGKD